MKKMKIQSRLLAMVLVLLMLVGLVGCGGDSGSQGSGNTDSQNSGSNEGSNSQAGQATGTGAAKDTLSIALNAEPNYISTCDHDSLTAVQINYMTYNGLMRIDMETLQPVCDLATDYTQEDDLNWVFNLQEGVKFHNGDDFTAADVIATIEYAQSFPASVAYTGNISNVEAISDYSVRITTSVPTPNLLFDLGYHYNFILPKSLIESGNDFNTNPVGTGPYKFITWEKGNYMSFEAFEDYFDESRAARIPNVRFVIIPEGSTRSMALESGQVDFVYETATTDIDRLKNTDGITVEEVASVENFSIFLNCMEPPFSDANLRNAISYALNREDIVQGALNGYATPSYSVVSAGYAEYTNANAVSFDLDKAKEYLAAWGGDPSTVTLNILCSNDTKVAIATIMMEQLSELGIKVDVETCDQATYLSAMTTPDICAAIESWSPANAFTYVTRFHTDRHGNTPASLSDAKMDEMVEKMRVCMDSDERSAIITDIILYADELNARIPIYLVNYYRSHSSDLKNVVCSATGYVDVPVMEWN